LVKIFNGHFHILFWFDIDSATVLYDQPPEFFHPGSLEEKHKVKQVFLFIPSMMNSFI